MILFILDIGDIYLWKDFEVCMEIYYDWRYCMEKFYIKGNIYAFFVSNQYRYKLFMLIYDVDFGIISLSKYQFYSWYNLFHL